MSQLTSFLGQLLVAIGDILASNRYRWYALGWLSAGVTYNLQDWDIGPALVFLAMIASVIVLRYTRERTPQETVQRALRLIKPHVKFEGDCAVEGNYMPPIDYPIVRVLVKQGDEQQMFMVGNDTVAEVKIREEA